MSESAIAFMDLPVHNMAEMRNQPLGSTSNVKFGLIDDISKAFPNDPSLLRLNNTRFLMDNINTDDIPDWDTLKAVTFDHDLSTAIKMISLDTINGYRIARKTNDGANLDEAMRDEIDLLDDHVDISEIYRAVTYDELRYGNAFVRKNFGDIGDEKRLMYALEIIKPQRIVNMVLSPFYEPMWWVLEVATEDMMYGSVFTFKRIAYVDPKYSKQFKGSGYSDAEIVGEASDIVHFKGDAPKYQKWGIGIGQIAKLLVEAKVDMLVDSSKIIKKEAATREMVFIDVTGLGKAQADAKIDDTVTQLTAQRKRGTIMVLGKKGKEDALEVQYLGSEGKVLDNFTMHYRDHLLQAIRILTRIPPSFWLGEATNKATINKQVTVYNGFLSGKRLFNNKRIVKQIFKPYLEQQLERALRIRQLPQPTFSDVVYMDAMDRAIIDDIYIRNWAKSRKQVADENDFRLPEEDGVLPPQTGGSEFAGLIQKNMMEIEVGVGDDGAKKD